MVEKAQRVGDLLDSLIGIFAPARAARRAQERARAMSFRSYAAAKRGPFTAGFGAVDKPVNDIFAEDSAVLRARTRQLCRDFPLFARILDVNVNLTIGTGIKFQFQAVDGAGKPNRDLNKRVEDEYAGFAAEMSTCGRLNDVELQRLARRQEIECGEAFGVTPIDAASRHPIAVQLYEPEWLNGYGAKPKNGCEVVNSVEVNTRTGRVEAYWIADPYNFSKPQRIEKRDALHSFRTLRPGQLRGISPLVTSVMMARDIGEYIGAEVEGAMMAARWLAKRKTSKAAGQMPGLIKPKGVDDGTRLQELGYNIIELLSPGEDLELVSHDRPGSRFESTVNLMSRFIATASGLTHELVTGDYKGINYSNLKGIRSDLLQQIRPEQHRFARQFCFPIAARWLDAMALQGKIELPDYWQRRTYYHSCIRWGWPEMPGVDELRQMKALLMSFKAGVFAPQDELAKRGLDAEETLRKIKSFQKLAEELEVDLDWGGSSTSLQNNPAALGAEESTTGDDHA